VLHLVNIKQQRLPQWEWYNKPTLLYVNRFRSQEHFLWVPVQSTRTKIHNTTTQPCLCLCRGFWQI